MTTRNPFDGAFERVKRAGKHLADLRLRLETVSEQLRNAHGAQFNPVSPHQFEFFVPVSAPVSTRIPILTGEICYNLRGALDYLVYELARFDASVLQNGTQFPICDRKKDFDKTIKTKLKGLNSRHILSIEALQPFEGCGWTKTLRVQSG